MFSKTKQNKIEFFTDFEGLLDTPPQPANRFYPDWFKKTAASHSIPPTQKFPLGISEALGLSNVNVTVRRCPGIISLLSEGYIVPLWSDHVVQVRPNTINAFAANHSGGISLHSQQNQYKTMPLPEGYYPDAVKFTNPWKVVTPKGWSVLVMAPFYQFENRFQVLPGVVDADSYHHIHVNTLFKSAPADHQLKMGMPFIQVIPFERKALEMEVRHSTDQDKKRIENLRFKMDKFFAKNKAIKSESQD
ncbi:hypothetical protein FLL45_10980 [Aliikangiella marina]|uniref:Uncharacterized protein n=1 Tax=Aliikangiella marina TaxID=1712262 RepID=A0A545TDY8_9GAMM|nr:hypothetical protein [Aliikangiella marina]TQV75437.1 hypothetical protein FLL45_10980 [Aliikangiella marina]